MFVFANTFTVTGDPEEFEKVVARLTAWMTGQPGFVRSRFCRSLKDPKVYFEVAEWEDAADHANASGSPAFKELIPELMKVATASPGGYELLSAHG